MISNRTRAARSFDFEITCMTLDQIALHSVQLPLYILLSFLVPLFLGNITSCYISFIINSPHFVSLNFRTVPKYLQGRNFFSIVTPVSFSSQVFVILLARFDVLRRLYIRTSTDDFSKALVDVVYGKPL